MATARAKARRKRSAGSPRASTATRRRTIAGGFRRRRGSIDPVESHVAIDAAVLVPVRLDLHMQEQVNLAPQQLGQLGACLAADFLDPFTLVAKDDCALVVACDQYLLVDFGAAVGTVREFLGLDGRLVRQ